MSQSSVNRIVVAIARMKEQIDHRIAMGLVTADQVEKTRKALDMDLEEYTTFQELKSIASAGGALTLDEGMAIYGYLGENGPEEFNAQSVEVKTVLTKAFHELLGAKLASSCNGRQVMAHATSGSKAGSFRLMA
jgi:hypothetical protein